MRPCTRKKTVSVKTAMKHLTGLEKSCLVHWKDRHVKSCYFESKPILDRFSVEFITGHLGSSIFVHCKCGAKKDITDYEAW